MDKVLRSTIFNFNFYSEETKRETWLQQSGRKQKVGGSSKKTRRRGRQSDKKIKKYLKSDLYPFKHKERQRMQNDAKDLPIEI